MVAGRFDQSVGVYFGGAYDWFVASCLALVAIGAIFRRGLLEWICAAVAIYAFHGLVWLGGNVLSGYELVMFPVLGFSFLALSELARREGKYWKLRERDL